MTELVALQAVALALLALLIGGLLRSHAEIVRSLHRLGAELGDPAAGEGGVEQAVTLAPRPSPRLSGRLAPRASAAAAIDVAGTTPAGEAVRVAVRSGDGDTLLAFLSTSCTTCLEFWRALARPSEDLSLPEGIRLVVVTKGAPAEDVAEVRRLAPTGRPVVLSTEAWGAYGIPSTPFFIHVDGPTGKIVGQGSGSSWDQVIGLVRQAGADTEAEMDRRLLAAGIRPGDPRLYPTGDPQ